MNVRNRVCAFSDVICVSAILSVKSNGMGKACCAVGCSNRFVKGSGVHFYRFPQDEQRKSWWIAAVGRKDWIPNEYSWICSVLVHFVSGEKSNNPLSPNYAPSLFEHVKSPLKKKREHDFNTFQRNVDVLSSCILAQTGSQEP